MKENAINTIINNNFKRIGFSHKIADPMGGEGIQNPFDGFSVILGKSIYWETKRLVGYKAFNFNLIAPHQIRNLKIIKQINPNAICIIIVAIWESHKFLDLFFFDIDYILNLKNSGKKSILKKELLELKEQNKYLTVKKKMFDINNLLGRIIYE